MKTDPEKYKQDEASAIMRFAEIIREKTFLKKIYAGFYDQFRKEITPTNGSRKVIIEVGSGGGFIKEMIPEALTSEIVPVPFVDNIFSALKMPFKNNSVDFFLMIDVFHHIHDSWLFLKELERCLRCGGRAMMIEPANTLWSRLIYKNFHHETFNPAGDWMFDTHSPLFSANGALPWIVFQRDYKKFEERFPSLKLEGLEHHTPFRYLASGGLSKKQLLPLGFYNALCYAETLLSPFNQYLGMFMTVRLKKVMER